MDVHCSGGRVTALAPRREVAPPPVAVVVPADGGLVTEPFVDAHLHLDKVRTLPLIGDAALEAYTAEGMAGSARGIDLARAVKRTTPVDTLLPPIREALADGRAQRRPARAGVRRRRHRRGTDRRAGGARRAGGVPRAGRRRRRRVSAGRRAADPGTAELVEQALALGADVVGGIPWIEATAADQEAHVDWACALAARLGRRVAMLTDDAPDPAYDTTRMLAEAMRRHGLRGGAWPATPGRRPLPEGPTGRAPRPGPRGGAGPGQRPAHRFGRATGGAGAGRGVDVALGQDDIEDAYYPFGRHNLLEVAFLAAHLLDMRSAPQQEVLVDLVTTSAARVLGLPDYGLREGGPADLLVHEATRTVDLLARHAPPRTVVRHGRVLG